MSCEIYIACLLNIESQSDAAKLPSNTKVGWGTLGPVPPTQTNDSELFLLIEHQTLAAAMTSRNLNTTWRAVIFKQYAEDFEADVPFPVRYLISAPPWKDIFIAAPHKIDLGTYKRAILAFYLARRFSNDPTHEDENISVRPRKPVSNDNPDWTGNSTEEDVGKEPDVDMSSNATAGKSS